MATLLPVVGPVDGSKELIHHLLMNDQKVGVLALEEANKPRQKPVFRLESGEYIDVQTIWDSYGPASQPSSRGSSS